MHAQPGGNGELEEAVARVRRTRRPSPAALAQLAAEAAALPCASPEERPIARLLSDYSDWQVRRTLHAARAATSGKLAGHRMCAAFELEVEPQRASSRQLNTSAILSPHMHPHKCDAAPARRSA